jgi:hypothetical protein
VPILLDRTGAVLGNERQSVLVTVSVPDTPTRVIVLDVLPGTGSVVRRG